MWAFECLLKRPTAGSNVLHVGEKKEKTYLLKNKQPDISNTLLSH